MKMSCVLIVDDSESDQFLSKHIIEKNCPNTEVLQAYDGLEALEILKETDRMIDLIILDINMPRMDGHEFLEVYEQTPVRKKSPVIVMLSSSCDARDREKSMAYDFVVDYFIKALGKDDLIKLKNNL